MRNSKTALCLFFSAVFLTPAVLFGQDRGAISGNIKDSSDAVVAGAAITVLNPSKGVSLKSATSSSGDYYVGGLLPGVYDLKVQVAGFQTATRTGIEVRVGEVERVDFRMEVGSLEQTVEVSAQGALLNTATSDLGTTVSRDLIQDLPVQVGGSVRDPLAFARLTPGFTGSTANSAIEYQTFSTVNGGQTNSTQIMVDGADVQLSSPQTQFSTAVSIEAVEEFKVMSSSYSAEYGRSTGGIINLTLKTGTNTLHGSAYDYLRNDKFDARGFFNADRTVNRQNDFGGLLTGPVYIPKIYNGRDKTFFTFAYEGFRYRQGALNSLGTYPIADFRNGDFSKLVDDTGKQIPIYDPQTTVLLSDGTVQRQQFPGNKIRSDRFDPVAVKAAALLPPLTFPDRLTNNVNLQEQLVNGTNIITTRGDHSLTSRQRITGTFSEADEQDFDNFSFGAIGSSGLAHQHTTYARAAHDFIISPTILNHVLIGYSRRWRQESPKYLGDYAAQIGLKNVGNQFFPTFNASGYTAASSTFGSEYWHLFRAIDASVQWNEALTIVRAKHTLKFGTEGRRQQFNVNDLVSGAGSFSFGAGLTGLPGSTGPTGDGWASFMLGAISSANLNYLGTQSAHRFRTLSFFVQDDFRASQRLTLNLGLRWDRFSPLSDPTGRLSVFDPTVPNPAAGGIPGAMVYAGNGPGRTGKNSFQNIWNKAFGPRAGLAYKLSERTVFRAGYGIFYQEPREAGWGGASNGFFATPSYSSADGYTPLNFYLRDGFPTDFPKPPFLNPSGQNGKSVNVVDPQSGRPPIAQNWQASIERQINRDLMLEVAYVGANGHHLVGAGQILNQVDPKYLPLGSLLRADINSPAARAAGIPIPYPGFTGTVRQALRPFPQVLGVSPAGLFQANKLGNSTYNALQVKLQGRILPGLRGIVSCTWSKALNDGANQSTGEGFLPNGGSLQNGFNRRAEKDVASQDIPHNLVMSLLYEVPWGPGKKMLNSGPASRVLGGWSIGALLTYQSGLPIDTPTPASSDVPLFAGSIRPNRVAGVTPYSAAAKSDFDPNRDVYLNSAAWTSPPPFQFGNASRESGARVQPLLNEDMSVLKTFMVHEPFKLQFRAEAFDVFNRVVFGFPSTGLGSSDFGMIFSQRNRPRTMQLSLKMLF